MPPLQPDDDFSNLAARDASVAAPAPPPSAIQGSIAEGEVTPGDAGVRQAPPQKPNFFRGLITTLGMVLAQGTKAGIQAPLGPEGPSIAARTAIEQPQKDFETRMANQKALTSADLDKMTVAMTQLKLHQLHMITNKMDDDQRDAVYNKGRDTLQDLAEKGKVDIYATGDYASVTAEFQKRQADAQAGGQGLIPLQILPAVGSTAAKPQYSLVMVGKEKLAEGIDETWGPSDIGYSPEDFKAAGLSTFKFHAAAGMDQQKAMNLKVSQYLNWSTKSENAMAAWKKNQATIGSREREGQKNRDMRLTVAELNNSTRRAVAQEKKLNDQTDKEVISAGKTLVQANKNLANAQGKIGNKAWDTLGGGDAREITTLRRARDEAQKNYDTLLAKKQAGPATSGLNELAIVPKGTIADKAIIQKFLQNYGDDAAKARKALTDHGYTIPPKTPPKQQGQ